MANKKPLICDNGDLKELPSSATIDASSILIADAQGHFTSTTKNVENVISELFQSASDKNQNVVDGIIGKGGTANTSMTGNQLKQAILDIPSSGGSIKLNTLPIRYIKNTMCGNTTNGYSAFIEIQAMKDGVNKALNKTVTANFTLLCTDTSTLGTTGTVTNGITTSSDYVYYNDASAKYARQVVQVDLGALQLIDSISMWHYYADGRKHYGNMLEVSCDGYNWITVFNSNIQGEYVETSSGKTINLSDVSIEPYKINTLDKLPIRYIRDWLYGSNVNTGNHWVEVQAINSAGVNKALTMIPTSNTTLTSTNVITNGDTNTLNYTDGAPQAYPCYVQIDLVNTVLIDTIKVWHYYADNRIYKFTRTEVSADGITWYQLWDSELQGTYKETSGGRTYPLRAIEIELNNSILPNLSVLNSARHDAVSTWYDNNNEMYFKIPKGYCDGIDTWVHATVPLDSIDSRVSDTVRASAPTYRNGNGTNQTVKLKEIKVNSTGYIRCKFTLNGNGSGYVRIRRNGNDYGVITSCSNQSNTVHSEDLYFSTGDLAQIWVVAGTVCRCELTNFNLCFDQGATPTVTLD